MARPKKNPMITASQLPPTDTVDHKEVRQRDLPEPKDPRIAAGLAGEIAQDFFYVRNSRIPNAVKHFPVDPLKRTVDKYFERAAGGPLYIDEPVTESEIKICQEKAKIMELERARYAYITQEMELDDVLRQFEKEPDIGVA
jgi:hypothetical protein